MDINTRHEEAENEIQDLLNLLKNTFELNLQINIFSTLGAYLLSNGEHRSVIIKYAPLYNKILQCLTSGRSLQHVTLNFVSALLYIDIDEGPTRRKALHIHAQNMIRVSGCLSAMCDLFVTCMMHQDTWRALCRSLAEVCRGSSINQSYCAHIIPLCIQKIQRGDTNAVNVLQSLMTNQQNNKLFHINDGMSIFTRDMVQDLSCLELLNTVIENLEDDCIEYILQAKQVFQELRNLTLSHGCCPQVIQWKTIIFYSCERVLGNRGIVLCERQKTEFENVHTEIGNEGDETQNLFQNIFREVRNFHFNKNNEIQEDKEKPLLYTKNTNKQSRSEPSFRKTILNRKNHLKKLPPKTFRKITPKNQEDLSFSFLLNSNKTSLQQNVQQSVDTQINSCGISKIINIDRNSNYVSRATNTTTVPNYLVNRSILTNENEIDFNPVHASTPKRKYNYSSQENVTESTSLQQSHPTFRKRTKKYTRGNPRNMSKMRNRSLSSKFLDVVNQSCTTIIKSFKSVFNLNSHKKSNEDAVNEINNYHNDTCSYSFTNYMQKRDNFFAAERSGFETVESGKGLSKLTQCSSCNNTLDLKEKMLVDPRLKDTVKKLKLGINLFGCDFKKISRTFWPNEKYMTPSLLYSLYRKLINKR